MNEIFFMKLAKLRKQYTSSQGRLRHRKVCHTIAASEITEHMLTYFNVARKIVIASAADVFLRPDKPSVIFEADNDPVFHNGYCSQIILVVLLMLQP